MLRAVRPIAYGSELALQRLGRGWWGPSQLMLARRYDPATPYAPGRADGAGLAPRWAGLAARMACPSCLRSLVWRSSAAVCPACELSFPRRGEFWDFVVERGANPARPSTVHNGPYSSPPQRTQRLHRVVGRRARTVEMV
jgi:hypothetical protein